MKKKCQYILLPTKEASNIHLEEDGVIEYYKNSLPNIKANPHHLYILSDDKIKEGDKCYDQIYKRIVIIKSIKGNFVSVESEKQGLKHSNIDNLKKVIATTNPELHKSYVSIDDVCKPDCTLLPQISQSDVEYIISLYNGKSNSNKIDMLIDTLEKLPDRLGKEIDVDKMIIEKAQQYAVDSHSPNRAARSAGFIDGYNQCLQDNADKKFTLEDIRDIVWKSIYLEGGFDKEGFSFYKDDNEIMDECIQSLTKEQPKNDTVMVEYESEGLPSKQIKIGDVDLTEFNDNPYKPKLKDNCIIIHKNN